MALSHRQRAAARRLTAAVLLPRLLVQLKGEPLSEADDPALLADLLALIEADPDFAELGKALLDGHAGAGRSARFGALWLSIQDRLPPRGHHHLALLHCHWGWQAQARIAHAGPAAVRKQWTRALAHIARVLGSPDFFADLGRSCGAPDSAETLHARAAELWLAPHVDAMLDGLHPDITPDRDRLKSHWAVLTQASNLAKKASPTSGISSLRAHITDAAAQALAAASDQAQRRIVQHVLHHARRLSTDLEPTASKPEEVERPFAFATTLTDIIGPREALTIWAIDQCIAWSWPLYKSDDMTRLRPLIASCEPFGNHLEHLLRTKTGAFGRQSKCATFLLFLADFRSGDEEEMLLERALVVCPGHRNSRLMLSYSRLKKANVELAKVENADFVTRYLSPSAAQRHVEQAQLLIEEAEELFAGNEKLPIYRERLKDARTRLER